MGVRIVGIASHLPNRVETNEQLASENPDWDMTKIAQKSGIMRRHISAQDETAADLAFSAGRKLLERNLVDPSQIDLLMYCTQCPDYVLPTTACMLQTRLGLPKSLGALDFNLGCSGYVYGLYLAKATLASGMARNVLLLTADTYSKLIHPRDRTVRTLFGDGASATLLSTCDGLGIGEFVLGSDGSGADNLIVPSGGFRLPRSPQTGMEMTDSAGCVRTQDNLYMNGSAIFAFAITTVPPLIVTLLRKSGLIPENVDWFVYHQANKMMLEELAKRNKLPLEKVVIDCQSVGNTVSSSIPMAIESAVRDGRIRSGHRLVLIGFGVGYSWGACDLVWS